MGYKTTENTQTNSYKKISYFFIWLLKKITLSEKVQLCLISMREHLGKYILKRRLNLVVMITVTHIFESFMIDEERKINNTSETKLQEYNIFFHLKFRAIGRRAVEIINFL